ncbi:hypothetical protein Taro_032052 [Colocasia esculenta]|uniref:Uncharacterized protein n=1 Tax=Colocasia esculenta TaxID=4460 RepID=A0A843VY83_COLES|nr:hypothetical protein [Colocasia esculenta]
MRRKGFGVRGTDGCWCPRNGQVLVSEEQMGIGVRGTDEYWCPRNGRNFRLGRTPFIAYKCGVVDI